METRNQTTARVGQKRKLRGTLGEQRISTGLQTTSQGMRHIKLCHALRSEAAETCGADECRKLRNSATESCFEAVTTSRSTVTISHEKNDPAVTAIIIVAAVK
jgi:hypothetical protein